MSVKGERIMGENGKWRVYLAGVTVSLIFGLSFLFTKAGIEHVGVYTFLSYRFGIATLTILLLNFLKIVRISKKPYWKLWKVVLFQPIMYFIFETNGLKYASSSEAGMIIATIPIVIAFLSPFMLKEKLHWFQVLFAFASFLGVSLIVGGGGFEKGALLGKLLVLCAVFSAAFYNIFSRKLSILFEPMEITFAMMLTGFLFFTFMSIVTGQFAVVTNLSSIISALYLGILSSTVAFFLVNYMLSKVSPTVSSLFSNLTTIVSVLAGSVIRNEKILFIQIIGMVMILASLVGNSYLSSKVKNKTSA